MKRAKHSLSNYKLLSCDMGKLIPIGLTEVLAGDSIQHTTNALVRAAPLLSPVMHPVVVSIAHWFVPNRLIWDDWEKFITGGPDGMDATVHPTITTVNPPVSSLLDYMGVPPGTYSATYSALPFRAYAMIFNEWYRDQDLVTPVALSTASGADSTTNLSVLNGAWEKDYFTSARPWEQKGPAITIPLGSTAPVTGISVQAGTNFVANPTATFGTTAAGDLAVNDPAGATDNLDVWLKAQSIGAVGSGNRPQIFADLSGASAVTVNVLREALALQRYEEARARYGSRYTEYLRYLGVRSSDARLQRPEYLGGGKETISFSEVLQTAEGADPVGTLRGHGISSMRSNRYRRFFEEHGFVITLLCARPKAIYADGMPRTFNRRTKEDYWQKELEHIGQQPVQNQEVYAPHATPTGTFGYQDRYDEYRRTFSSIAGEFRTILNFWHFARQFASAPALNADFVKCVPTEVPFAVPSEHVLQIMARHSIQARRLVTQTGTSFIY